MFVFSYTDFEILRCIVSKEVFHFWIHCAVSVDKVHRLWIGISPHEIGARVRSRGPGDVAVSDRVRVPCVAQIPWPGFGVPQMTSPVFTGKASVKRVLISENVFEQKLYRIFKCCLRTGRLGRTQELLLDGMKISAELSEPPATSCLLLEISL